MSFGRFVGSGLTLPCLLPPSSVIWGGQSKSPASSLSIGAVGGGGRPQPPPGTPEERGASSQASWGLGSIRKDCVCSSAPGAFWGPGLLHQPGGQAFGTLSMPWGSRSQGPYTGPPAPPTSFPRRERPVTEQKSCGAVGGKNLTKIKESIGERPSVN